jgi:hypothetical protein
MKQENDLGEPLWFKRLQERIAELEKEDAQNAV